MCTNGFRILTMFLFAIIAFVSNYFIPSVPALIWYFITVSMFSFILFGIDKLNAVKGRIRVPANSFHFLALVGGGIGVMLGIVLFRHKTGDKKFIAIQFGILIIYFAAAFFIIHHIDSIKKSIEVIFGH